MVLAICQIILHLNKITECLKMTTFKIVFTFDVFFSAETTMHCKVTCILYKKQAHFTQLFCLQVRSVTPWQIHDRKSRCLRGRRHSFASITCSPRKVSRFAPLNRYYYNRWSLFGQFFGNYLFISCMQKKIIIHSFWSTLIIYLLVVYIKNNNSFILVSGILLNTKGRIFFSKKNHREEV
jgi:hypothetical protein